MEKNKGKYKALLGVLIVLIIPFVLITTVYRSKKPEIKRLPILTEQSIEFSKSDFNSKDRIEFFHEDIKVVLPPKSQVDEEVKNLIQKTSSYPKRTFKDRHSEILFIGSDTLSTSFENVNYLSNVQLEKIYLSNDLDSSKILLLDHNNNLRGTYDNSKIGIENLDLDIQHLMIETLSDNSQNDRIFK